MNHRKQPERRTFLQDRFEILIKRQQSGKATFNELTELDDMVNRDPELREKVIRENIFMEGTDDFNGILNRRENESDRIFQRVKQKSLLTTIREFLSRIFISKTSAVKIRIGVSYTNQISLV